MFLIRRLHRRMEKNALVLLMRRPAYTCSGQNVFNLVNVSLSEQLVPFFSYCSFGRQRVYIYILRVKSFFNSFTKLIYYTTMWINVHWWKKKTQHISLYDGVYIILKLLCTDPLDIYLRVYGFINHFGEWKNKLSGLPQ